jgi:MFS family permease
MQMVNAYLYYLVPTLAPVISASVDQGSSFVGWLAAVSTIGSIAFMLAGTPIVRRVGSLRALQVGTAVGGLGLLFLFLPYAWAVVLGNVMMGLGYGPSSPAGSDILHRFSPPQHRNLIFSIRQAGVPLSGLAAGLFLPSLYGWGGWTAVIVCSASLVVLSIAAVQPLRDRIDTNRDPDQRLSAMQLLSLDNLLMPLRAVTAIPSLQRVAIAGACLAAGHGCWVAYLVTLLTEVAHRSLVEAGAIFAAMQAAGVVGRLLLGWLSDRLGSGLLVLRAVALASAATSLALPIIAAHLGLPGLCLAAALAGLTVSSWNGVQIAMVASLAPPEQIALCASGATILVFCGFVAGPALFALLLNHNAEYPMAFGAIAAMTLLGAGLFFTVRAQAARNPH